MYPAAFYQPRPQGLVEIGAPTLCHSGENSTLQCSIRFDGEEHLMTISVPAAYGQYLVHERADAFLVVMLPLVARRGGHVKVHAPVSAYLLHNLRHLLSPALPLYSSLFHPLEIEAEADDTEFHGTHVGTGCSCGVDSLATVLTYTEPGTPASMKVDTLCFFNAGAHGCMKPEEERKKLCEDRDRLMRAFAEDIDLPLLRVDTNMQDFADGCWHLHNCTFRNAACVLALQKYFRAYHVASEVPVNLFELDAGDPALSDEFLVPRLSTESSILYSALAIQDRFARTAVLADSPLAHRHLNVCLESAVQCGRCIKCVRTMFMLEQMGKLEKFDGVFDVKAFLNANFYDFCRIKSLLIYDSHFHDEYIKNAERMEAMGIEARINSRQLKWMFLHDRLTLFVINQAVKWRRRCHRLRSALGLARKAK